MFVVRLEDVAAGDDADEFFRVRFHDDGDVADVTGDEAVEDDVERFVRVGDDEVFRHDVFDQDRFRVDADEFVARVAERDDTGERAVFSDHGEACVSARLHQGDERGGGIFRGDGLGARVHGIFDEERRHDVDFTAFADAVTFPAEHFREDGFRMERARHGISDDAGKCERQDHVVVVRHFSQEDHGSEHGVRRTGKNGAHSGDGVGACLDRDARDDRVAENAEKRSQDGADEHGRNDGAAGAAGAEREGKSQHLHDHQEDEESDRSRRRHDVDDRVVAETQDLRAEKADDADNETADRGFEHDVDRKSRKEFPDGIE